MDNRRVVKKTTLLGGSPLGVGIIKVQVDLKLEGFVLIEGSHLLEVIRAIVVDGDVATINVIQTNR